jgi:hypothetical protein
MLSVVILSVIMLSVVAPFWRLENVSFLIFFFTLCWRIRKQGLAKGGGNRKEVTNKDKNEKYFDLFLRLAPFRQAAGAAFRAKSEMTSLLD